MNRRVYVVLGGALAMAATARYASWPVSVAPTPIAVSTEMRDVAVDAPDDAHEAGPLEIALEDSPPYGNDVRRAVCGKRIDCRVIKVTPAGVAGDGRSRELVTVAPFAADAADAAPPERNYDDATIEHWLLFRRAGALVGRQWLVHDFEYSYSAVEDEPLAGVKLTPTTFAYTDRWKGLSRFTGTYSTEIDLERLVVMRHEGLSYDRLEGGEISMIYDLDYNSMRLRYEHLEPNCAVPPKVDPATGETIRPRPTAFRVQWDAIPRLAGVGSLATADPIAGCAPAYDGVRAGFVRSGKADAADGSFHAVLVQDSLEIDVIDDVLTDHDVLEVWSAPRTSHFGLLRCEPPLEPLTPPTGSEVALATGATRSLAGAIPPGIRVTRSPGRVRVTMPVGVAHDAYGEELPALAIVLRDSDDNATHERVITTTRGFAQRLVDLGEPGGLFACRRTPSGLVRALGSNPIRPLIGHVD